MKTLGIDPGSRNLGFGLVRKAEGRYFALAHGTLRFDTEVPANERLLEIFEGVRDLIAEHRPDHVAIERVFVAKNAVSALKLGQARAAAVVPVLQARLPLFEYTPNAIKLATVGFGHADKEQVSRMVARLLKLPSGPDGFKDGFQSSDASDALAIAICHLNSYGFSSRVRQIRVRAKEL